MHKNFLANLLTRSFACSSVESRLVSVLPRSCFDGVISRVNPSSIHCLSCLSILACHLPLCDTSELCGCLPGIGHGYLSVRVIIVQVMNIVLSGFTGVSANTLNNHLIFGIGPPRNRTGAHVLVTTRFPHDCAKRYAALPDFLQWLGTVTHSH